MATLFRSNSFREFVEKCYIESYEVGLGWPASRSSEKFKDNLYEDFTLLGWILENIFPNTVRSESGYTFITKPTNHRILVDNRGKDGNGIDIATPIFSVGKTYIEIKNGESYITYDNKEFKHGHADSESGRITCYGAYKQFYYNVIEIGFAGALMDAYNFSQVSHYNVRIPPNAKPLIEEVVESK